MLILSLLLANSPLTVSAAAPIISFQPKDQTVILYQPAAFGVIASGTAPLSYQWRKDGVPITGATNDQIVLAHAQFSDAGLYSVVVSNAEGSVTSADARLTVNSPTGGDLDYSFAWGGLGRAFERVASITVQADGKILVAGELRRNQPLDYAFECRWDDPIHVHERTFRGLRRDPLCRDPFGRCSSRRQRCSSGASSLR